jgi:hypothetical protein
MNTFGAATHDLFFFFFLSLLGTPPLQHRHHYERARCPVTVLLFIVQEERESKLKHPLAIMQSKMWVPIYLSMQHPVAANSIIVQTVYERK